MDYYGYDYNLPGNAGYGYDGDYGFLGGAIAGALVSLWVIIGIILYAIDVIGYWKLFTKAGEEGWKSLIPIYNLVILFKISSLSPWLILVCLANFIPFVGWVAWLVVVILQKINIARNFGKSGWFAFGLVIMPSIFYLILGFDSSVYEGDQYATSNFNNNINAKYTVEKDEQKSNTEENSDNDNNL